ncbi:MAG TPA: hypothetical protein VLZ07_10595 [Syntrophales bacterium]|nr:hypothetical protein [Syntrophales bacterium]
MLNPAASKWGHIVPRGAEILRKRAWESLIRNTLVVRDPVKESIREIIGESQEPGEAIFCRKESKKWFLIYFNSWISQAHLYEITIQYFAPRVAHFMLIF